MALPNLKAKDFKPTPHGKVADPSLPPDWDKYTDNLSKFVNLGNGDAVVDGVHGLPLTITTVPPRSSSGKEDPAGHTEFLYLSEDTRSKAFNCPGFPKPVNTPKIPKYEVREAPGKGRGVYATCDMHPGDLIWVERPFVVSNLVIIPPKGYHAGDHHTEAQRHALKLYAAERTSEAIVNRLTPERKARFMSLANSHKEDGSGPCMGILRTNQLEIRMAEGEPGPDPSERLYRYAAVGDVLSLTNHSCIPNIRDCFDFASFSLQIYAWARIKKGDELVWSYIGGGATVAERQKALSPYGFICNCRICIDPRTEMLWNTFRMRSYAAAGACMRDLLKEDLDNPFHKKSPAGKEARMREYADIVAPVELLQKESDSYGFMGELRLLCLLHELYRRVGNESKRRRYATLIIRWTKWGQGACANSSQAHRELQ